MSASFRTIRICVALSGLLVVHVAADTSAASDHQFVATGFGFFRGDGLHVAANPNYVTGQLASQIPYYRSFFLFDLSAFDLVPGQSISQATLSLTTFSVVTTDPEEVITLYDVNTSAATLLAETAIDSPVGLNVHDDLGTGAVFGSQSYTPADSSVVSGKTIPLNAAAIAAIASATDAFAIGSALTTLNPAQNNEFVYGGASTVPSPPVLTITTVPEPSSATIFVIVLAVVLSIGKSSYRRQIK